jgi:hypothetical protein
MDLMMTQEAAQMSMTDLPPRESDAYEHAGAATARDFTQELPRKLPPTRAKERQSHLRQNR